MIFRCGGVKVTADEPTRFHHRGRVSAARRADPRSESGRVSLPRPVLRPHREPTITHTEGSNVTQECLPVSLSGTLADQNGEIDPRGAGAATGAQGRSERVAKRKATITARRAATGHRIGTKVTTNTPRSPRFHNRTASSSPTTSARSESASEPTWSIRLPDADAWFLPTELERIR